MSFDFVSDFVFAQKLKMRRRLRKEQLVENFNTNVRSIMLL